MQSKISILIVEDTKFINHFLKEFFTKSGYEVFQAFTLSEAESTLNSYDINYVLLDLILPDGEGEVLLKVILEKSASSTKIIALTSDNDIQRRHSFLELGALDYFIKDEHLETICSKIDGLIQNVEENYHYNILIVDDSDFSRRLIKGILNTRNYATVTARNGELALNIINSLPVDLMILDYEMPGMNGYELLVEMKKSKNLSEIPVIMVSGSQDKDLIANILKLGARDFIRKPFAMQEILIRVDSALFNKKSLNRLDEQKRFFSDYQDIVNQTDIVIELDMTCNIINSNAIFSKKTGFEKFYLIGKNINTITVSNELDCNELLHSLNPGMIWQGRLDIKKDDGTVLYVDATFAMIDNRENIALTYIGLFHDVSKLVDAEYRAQKAIQSKASFLANMSHEIRTPLNAVVGFLSLLKNKEEEPTKLKYIETIQGASDTLLTVINDILDFSKIESGKLEIEKIGFHTEKLFDDLGLLFLEKANEKGINLITKIDDDLPKEAFGDPTRIKQVVSNLLSNAIKFTKDNGLVEMLVQFQASEKKLFLTIKDNGIGMSEATQEKILMPFSQASESITREYGGTGLGLSISSELLEMMGSKLEVKSQEGEGSAFSFALDLFKSESIELKSSDNTTLERKVLEGHVLIAEDNPTNTMLLEILLGELGLTYESVVNGKEAIERVKTRTFDLILMDENMPVMSGMQATQEIRKSEIEDEKKCLPIIAVTANALKGQKELFLLAGMDDYIEKPINERKLYESLAKFLTVTN